MGDNHKRSTGPIFEFWNKVEKTDDCWIFKSSLANGGYGRIWDNCKNRCVRAHRLSWEIHNGPIPKGMFVCHKCDNPPCVRPDHLFLGTNADNMLDKIKKGRQRGGGLRWQLHPRTHLTNKDVEFIRSYPRRWGYQTKLKKRFNVSQQTISSIINNINWNFTKNS